MGTELHAVFNGYYYDVSVGPHDYSQSVASCHVNSALGYGMEGAETYARLFAAAPDLLDACKTALRLIRAAGLCDRIGTHEIQAAIAKATQP